MWSFVYGLIQISAEGLALMVVIGLVLGRLKGRPPENEDWRQQLWDQHHPAHDQDLSDSST